MEESVDGLNIVEKYVLRQLASSYNYGSPDIRPFASSVPAIYDRLCQKKDWLGPYLSYWSYLSLPPFPKIRLEETRLASNLHNPLMIAASN